MNNFKIKEYENYNENEILSLYESVGWVNYTKNPDRLSKIFEGSLLTLGAYDHEKLIGFIRVVGDGYSIIYIQDIIVLPAYQRKGVGSLLVKKILDQYAHVYQTILLTDNQPNTVAFYRKMGFIPDNEMGCVAFGHFNF